MESNAGGEGVTPRKTASVSVSTYAHFLWPYPAHDISNQINRVSRFESKSFLENILESNAGGEGVTPAEWRTVSGSSPGMYLHRAGLVAGSI